MAVHESRNDDKWTTEVANKAQPARLIDQEIWWDDRLQKAMEGSERLQKLKNQPKNRNLIVDLPSKLAVARQFYCANCGCIPYPWAPDPSRILGLVEPSDEGFQPIKSGLPPAVFLCREGHAVCRTCYQSYYTCVLSRTDCMYLFGLEDSSNSEIMDQEINKLEPVYDSVGRWGLTTFCNARRNELDWKHFPCAFLTEMLWATEFACRYYHDFCDFRGKGKKLKEHEETCDWKQLPGMGKIEADLPGNIQRTWPPKFRTSLKQGDDTDGDDDDDSAILKVDLDSILEATEDAIYGILHKHGSEIKVKDLEYPYCHFYVNP